MRRFLCVGGDHDGEQVSIKHGRRVLMSGEAYRIYSEPLGSAMGVLLPEALPDDAAMPLLEEKFPWFKRRGLNSMTREEHLQWCKDRAMAYVQRGELVEAVTSMMSDLTKHPDTRHGETGSLAQLGLWTALQAQKGDRQAVERYILGFN